MNIVFFDTETTGINNPRLIQIAMKKGIDCYKRTFKPPIPITCGAMAVHHITEEMVALNNPVNDEYRQYILNYMADHIIVAHNSIFDLGVLANEDIRPENKCIDTLKIARRLWPNFSQHKLQYLRYKLGLKVEAMAHDAMGDVLVLEAVFNEMLKHISMEEMLGQQNRPIMLELMPFGKHKGKPIREILEQDKPYLDWLISQPYVEQNLRYTINKLLNPSL